MRERKSREASSHASGVVSASAFLVGHHPASRLRLSRHFLIARLPLLRDAGGAKFRVPRSTALFGTVCLTRRLHAPAPKTKSRISLPGNPRRILRLQLILDIQPPGARAKLVDLRAVELRDREQQVSRRFLLCDDVAIPLQLAV